jgi:hypothetical protein
MPPAAPGMVSGWAVVICSWFPRKRSIADVARELGYGKSRLYSLFSREIGSLRAWILSAGAGTFARVYVTETEGVSLAGTGLTPESVAAHFSEISEPSGAREITTGFDQGDKLAAAARRVVDRETEIER